jgi:hypothetical protein
MKYVCAGLERHKHDLRPQKPRRLLDQRVHKRGESVSVFAFVVTSFMFLLFSLSKEHGAQL